MQSATNAQGSSTAIPIEQSTKEVAAGSNQESNQQCTWWRNKTIYGLLSQGFTAITFITAPLISIVSGFFSNTTVLSYLAYISAKNGEVKNKSEGLDNDVKNLRESILDNFDRNKVEAKLERKPIPRTPKPIEFSLGSMELSKDIMLYMLISSAILAVTSLGLYFSKYDISSAACGALAVALALPQFRAARNLRHYQKELSKELKELGELQVELYSEELKELKELWYKPLSKEEIATIFSQANVEEMKIRSNKGKEAADPPIELTECNELVDAKNDSAPSEKIQSQIKNAAELDLLAPMLQPSQAKDMKTRSATKSQAEKREELSLSATQPKIKDTESDPSATIQPTQAKSEELTKLVVQSKDVELGCLRKESPRTQVTSSVVEEKMPPGIAALAAKQRDNLSAEDDYTQGNVVEKSGVPIQNQTIGV